MPVVFINIFPIKISQEEQCENISSATYFWLFARARTFFTPENFSCNFLQHSFKNFLHQQAEKIEKASKAVSRQQCKLR